MSGRLDLDAYLARIGYQGSPRADLATLEALTLAHVKAIAFENLDPLLERPVQLDIEALEHKLVAGRRGGYCFEHNTLFTQVLRASGFAVTGLAARVVVNQAAGAALPRTHMLLLVDVDGEPFIVDTGFGGQTPTGPLRLEADVAQTTPHEPFRLTSINKHFQMQIQIGESWTPLYEFDLQVQLEPDFVMMNHFTATYPGSVFRNMLSAARVTDDGRLGLRNNLMSIHRTGAPSERRALAGADEIRAVLAGPFGIVLPDDPGLDAIFERFAADNT
jgi:N-hydroxyarylamine O-acetyltransferase